MNAEATNAYDARTIVAALPDGLFSDVIRRPTRRLDLSGRVEHALTKTHTSRFEYQRNALVNENLGAGNFDLPERAYVSDSLEHVLRFADSGAIGKKLFNEFRFQTRWQDAGLRPVSEAPALLVLDAFNAGGAQQQSERRVTSFEIADNIDYAVGKHAMRFGALFEYERVRGLDRRAAGGTFTFASLEAFERGMPTTFTQRIGDPLVELSQSQFGWYAQDDFRISKSLTLSYGLRHEWQSNVDDGNRFAPRLSLAWSPFKSGATTIRAGAGIFNSWIATSTFEQTLRVDGARQQEIVVRDPGFPDPFAGGTPVTLPPSRYVLAPDWRLPSISQASFGVEQRLPKNFMLRTNFMYQRGTHLPRGRNLNAGIDGVRPDPLLGNVIQVEPSANSSTRQLAVSMNSPFAGRVQGLVSYLWTRSMNDADGPFSLPADNDDPRAEWGPAPWDVRHRFFSMLTVRMPKNMQLGTIFIANSAAPYNITTGFDDNGDTVSNDRPEGVGRNSARGRGHMDVGMRLSWNFGWGKPPETAAPTQRTRVIRADGSGEILGMTGGGITGKRFRSQLYVQAYNLFNRTNQTNFVGVQTSPFFGRAIAALPGRRIESGLRFSF